MTYISAICTDVAINQELLTHIKNSYHSLGSVTYQFNEVLHFVKANNQAKHIIFIKLDQLNWKVPMPQQLHHAGQCYPILIADFITRQYAGLLIKQHFAGVLTRDSLVGIQLNQMVANVLSTGHLVNQYITTSDWENLNEYHRPLPMPKFTDREYEVLSLLCHSLNGKDIADAICTSVSNVRNIMYNLKEKCMCSSEKELIIIAIANMWVTPKKSLLNKFLVNHFYDL